MKHINKKEAKQLLKELQVNPNKEIFKKDCPDLHIPADGLCHWESCTKCWRVQLTRYIRGEV